MPRCEADAYLPTVRNFGLGGYEIWMGMNYVELQVAPKIVKSLLGMFDELR